MNTTAKKWADWQERVFDEQAELNKKIDKLAEFTRVDVPDSQFRKLPLSERQLLVNQLNAMETYSLILTQRIMRFHMTDERDFSKASDDTRISNLEQRVKVLEALVHTPDVPDAVEAKDAFEGPWLTLKDLIHNIELMFDCRDGDYRYFHTDEAGQTHVYYTIRWGFKGGSASEAETKLIWKMQETFLRLRDRCTSARPILYWRFARQDRFGQDRYTKGAISIYSLRTRVAIPELGDWSGCENLFTLEDQELSYV